MSDRERQVEVVEAALDPVFERWGVGASARQVAVSIVGDLAALPSESGVDRYTLEALRTPLAAAYEALVAVAGQVANLKAVEALASLQDAQAMIDQALESEGSSNRERAREAVEDVLMIRFQLSAERACYDAKQIVGMVERELGATVPSEITDEQVERVALARLARENNWPWREGSMVWDSPEEFWRASAQDWRDEQLANARQDFEAAGVQPSGEGNDGAQRPQSAQRKR